MPCKFCQPKLTHFDFDSNVKKLNKSYWYKKKARGSRLSERKRKQRVCLKGRMRQVSRCNEELFFLFYFVLSILGLYKEVKQPLDRVCDDRRHCSGPRCLDKPSKHG